MKLNTSLRYIISRFDFFDSLGLSTQARMQTWKDFNERLIDNCWGVWEAVKDVLCFEAPEGHEINEEGDDLDIGTKDTLSFCWRALKESRSAS